jgi:hypothetical protein
METTYIIEQCGARWAANPTGSRGERAFWVFLVDGKSQAKPSVMGFYADSIKDACNKLYVTDSALRNALRAIVQSADDGQAAILTPLLNSARAALATVNA